MDSKTTVTNAASSHNPASTHEGSSTGSWLDICSLGGCSDCLSQFNMSRHFHDHRTSAPVSVDEITKATAVLSDRIRAAHEYLVSISKNFFLKLCALSLASVLSKIDVVFPDMFTSTELDRIKNQGHGLPGDFGRLGYFYTQFERDKIAKDPCRFFLHLDWRATKSTPQKCRDLDNHFLQPFWHLGKFKSIDSRHVVDVNTEPVPTVVGFKQDIIHQDGIYGAPRAIILLNSQCRIYQGLAEFARMVINEAATAPCAPEDSIAAMLPGSSFSLEAKPDEVFEMLTGTPVSSVRSRLPPDILRKLDEGTLNASISSATSRPQPISSDTPKLSRKKRPGRISIGSIVEPTRTSQTRTRRPVPTTPAPSPTSTVAPVPAPKPFEDCFSGLFLEDSSIPRPSQFGEQKQKARTEPKQKTRPTSLESFQELQGGGEDAPDPDPEPEAPDLLVFTDPDIFHLWSKIFPQTREDRFGRELSFADLRRVLRSPPLSFTEIDIGMPEVKLRRPRIGNTDARSFTFHLPHARQPVFKKIVLESLQVRMRQNFGWTTESFLLEEQG